MNDQIVTMHDGRRHSVSRRRKILGLVAMLVAVVIAVGVWKFRGIDDFSPPGGGIELTFSTDVATLSGTLHLPQGDRSAPIVLFVHGDGPSNRYADGGYNPMINSFVEDGIGVFTWDKPGIGKSTGNWLDQDMDDRAAEALAALDTVRGATDTVDEAIGFLGFSQAGWVLPKIAAQTNDEIYFVIVGGASNWQDQGDYYAKVRLQGEGATASEIASYNESERRNDADFLGPPSDYEGYVASADPDDLMSEDRFGFVARNYLVDSTEDLQAITSPVLAIWGEDDLNVDARHEAVIYEQALANGHKNTEVVLWPDATHSLLRADKYNFQLSSQWSELRQLEALGQGRRVFAPGVIDYIANWIHQNS